MSEALTTGAARLLTLTGPGGIGKTRLAVEVLSRLVEVYHGATWFVALADVADPAAVGPAIAASMRLERVSDRDPLDAVAAMLGPGRAILALDNFEQLVPGGVAVVAALLERAPKLSVLVTSRQRLGIPGEREVALGPLPVPPAGGPVAALEALPSVQLFVDRAQAVRPDFRLTSENAAAVAALVHHVEGIPLALALAAGRAQVLSPAQILERMVSRLDLATRDRVHPRHRALRATIEWSHRLLAAETRGFFARLAAFRGGFDLEAAEVVTADPLALDRLAELRECSLIAAEEAVEPRFRMLEAVRELAAGELAPEERGALARRHAAHFLALAERAAPHIAGPAQRDWLERIARDHENIRAAIEWSASAGEVDTGFRIAAALAQYWLARGEARQGRTLVERCLAEPGGGAASRARGLAVAGALAFALGDQDAAASRTDAAIALWREVGDVAGLARSLNTRGIVALACGDLGAAERLYGEAASLAREAGADAVLLAIVHNMSLLVEARGDLRGALALAEEALAKRRARGDRMGEASALLRTGHLSLDMGRLAGAGAACREALAIFQEVGSADGAARALNTLASIESDRGDVAAARALFEESLATFQTNGRLGIQAVLTDYATLEASQGDRRAAQALLDRAVSAARSAGDRLTLAMATAGLGDLSRRAGDLPAAGAPIREALAMLVDLGARVGLPVALESAAALALAERAFERAARLFGAAAALRSEMGAPAAPPLAAELNAHAEALRAALGEERAAAARDAGGALAWRDAARLALEHAGVDDAHAKEEPDDGERERT